MRHEDVVEFQGEGARAFQGAEFGAGVQGHAFALRAGDEHDVAAVHRRRVGPNVRVAQIRYPGQHAVHPIAAFDFFGAQVVPFNAGQVFDGVRHARAGQYFALQHVGQIARFGGGVRRFVQIPRAGCLTPHGKRGGAADFAHFADGQDLRGQAQTVAAFFHCAHRLIAADFAQFAHELFGIHAFAVDVLHDGGEFFLCQCGNLRQQGLQRHEASFLGM